MSRNHRRWEREDPASSHWEPEHHRSYSEYSRRRYGRPAAELPSRNSSNHWRDDVRNSYYPQRSYGRESYRDRWRDGDDGRSWHAESSYTYSRRRRDYAPGRNRDDLESWRNADRNSSHRNVPRRRHSAHTPPYTPRPSTRPIEPVLPPLKPDPPEPPQNASPPPMSSQLPKPGPDYLFLSKQPSEILCDPATTRKLLVLDLNGTLLIRSARSRNTSGLHLRPVQPRPYMQSFRQYLFCPETKAWLDTMVWSSAQPHSVDDMVGKVFGTAKSELKAVWNRKSLGLSEEDYHRKALATKDLSKPWELFASAVGLEWPHTPTQPQLIHSALTTLLLDDSPHKAVLQPYSHVCIPEYSSARRQQDLRTFLATKEPKQSKKAQRKNRVEATAHSTDQTLLPIDALTDVAEKESFDVILLAVIGILETVKLQSNVAGWIRGGGLLATQERGVEGDAHGVVQTGDGNTISNTIVRTGNDAISTSNPVVIAEQAHLQSKMWFEDSSVMAFWVARGRVALMELGIQVIHGVTG